MIVISCLVSLWNAIMAYKDKTKGMMLYCVLAIVMPVSSFGHMRISYEIIGFMFIVPVIMLDVFKNIKSFIKKEYIFLSIWVVIFSVATMITAFRYSTEINYILVLAMFRYLVLFIWFTNNSGYKENWISMMKIIVLINYVICLIQAFIPNAYKLFFELYAKNSGGQYVMLAENWGGVYRRLYGTFHTPAYSSYLFMIATACFLYQYFWVKNSKENLIYLIISLSGGLGTATKAYNFGMIMIVFGMLMLWQGYKMYNKFMFKKKLKIWKQKYLKTLPIICLCVVLTGVLFEASGVFVSVYLKQMNILSALQTRYNIIEESELEFDDEEIEETVNASTMGMTEALEGGERVIGFGATTPKGEPVQDSEWGIIFHDSGYVGLGIILVWLVTLGIVNLKEYQVENLMYLAVVVAFGLAIRSTLSILGIMLLSYVTINKTEIIEENFR